MVMNRFESIIDERGNPSSVRPAPTHVNALVLGVATAETLTIPTGANYVIFSSEGDFYVRVNAAATVPAGDVTDGSAAELNPPAYGLNGVTSLSVISKAANIVTAAFYKNSLV